MPDYADWTWQPTRVDWNADGDLGPACEKLGVQMGGPWSRYLSNGLLLAAGRADASTPGHPMGAHSTSGRKHGWMGSLPGSLLGTQCIDEA